MLKVDSALKDTMDVRNLLLWPCLLLALEGGLELRPRAEAQHSQVPTALASGSQASKRTWEAAEIFFFFKTRTRASQASLDFLMSPMSS